MHFQHIFNRVTEPKPEPVVVGCSVLDSHPWTTVCTMSLMKTRFERGDRVSRKRGMDKQGGTHDGRRV